MKLQWVIWDDSKLGENFTIKFGNIDVAWGGVLTVTTEEMRGERFRFPHKTDTNQNLLKSYQTFCRRMKLNR